MQDTKETWREKARVIWAITAKDMLEAVKNKNTIAVLLPSLLMVFFYRIYPTLFYGDEPLTVLAYDAGQSTLVAYLENSPAVNLYTYPSEEKLKEYLANGDVPELALVIPADFDQNVESGAELTLQGYVMYWLDAEDVASVRGATEAEISRLIGHPVSIQTKGNLVYHRPDSGGVVVNAGFGFMFIIVMVGISLVGHLFLEEKHSKTMDSLLVSPANSGDIVAAKAITGMFYCLLGAGVALIFHWDLVMHGWLAILTIFAASLFTTALGLLLGSMIENRGQLTLWSWVILMPLLLPMFLVLLDDLVPAALVSVLRLIPTVMAFNLLRTSFADPISIIPALLQVGWILVWALVVLASTAWLVRRQDRDGVQVSIWKSVSGIWQEKLRSPFQSGLQRTPLEIESPSDIGAAQIAPPEEFIQESIPSTRNGLQISLAIAVKDLREAVNNKIFISLILGVGVMIGSNALIPLLLQQNEVPTAYVYDQGRSTIIRGMMGDTDYRIGLLDTRQELEDAIVEAPGDRIGLILPADFDQKAGSGTGIELEGLSAHWMDAQKIERWERFFEEQLGSATWTPVNIKFNRDKLYPDVDAGGNIFMVITLLVVVITTMGAALTPLLLIEEKENRTLDILLASPTNSFQLILGKALAGAAFCLAAAIVVVFVHQRLFVSWWVVGLAILLNAAFAVAIGLLIGTLSDNPATTGMWGALIIIAVAASTILQFMNLENWPALLQTVISWFPGARLIDLFRFSMAESFPIASLFTSCVVLAAGAGALYLLAGLLVRRAYHLG